MKTILLTGGTGFIGSHVAVELLQLGYNVVIFDNLSNSKIEVLDRVEVITGKRPSFVKLDLCNYEDLDKAFKMYRIDSVIHFAGLKSVGESVTKPLDTYENNLVSTINLIKVMSTHGVKNLIFSSSATVYSSAKHFPVSEETPTIAINPYGNTKKIIEEILSDITIADNEWSITILRYFNPAGAHSSGLIGEDPNGIPTNLFPIITGVANRKYDRIKVFGNDYPTKDGTCIRDYIHVVDLAKGHVAALTNTLNGYNVFNLGSGVGYSVLETIKAFENVTGIEIPYEITARRTGDIPVSYADPQKANKQLDWKAELSLEDMCRDAWNWQLKNNNMNNSN